MIFLWIRIILRYESLIPHTRMSIAQAWVYKKTFRPKRNGEWYKRNHKRFKNIEEFLGGKSYQEYCNFSLAS